jgi:hypothetical protein
VFKELNAFSYFVTELRVAPRLNIRDCSSTLCPRIFHASFCTYHTLSTYLFFHDDMLSARCQQWHERGVQVLAIITTGCQLRGNTTGFSHGGLLKLSRAGYSIRITNGRAFDTILTSPSYVPDLQHLLWRLFGGLKVDVMYVVLPTS